MGEIVPGPRTPRVQDAAIADSTVIEQQLLLRGAYVTYMIAGLLVAVGVLQIVLDGSVERSIAAAGLDKPAVRAGQWWRLISATYLHGNWMHIWCNVAALVTLGRYVEAFSPRWHLPVVYTVAGAAGSLASLLLLSRTSIGASGAILGLAGYLGALGYLKPGALPGSLRASVLATIGLTALVGILGYFFIDNAAHLGGLAAGAVIAWLTARRAAWRSDRDTVPQWNLAGIVAAAVIVVSAVGTVAALAHDSPRNVSHVDLSLSSDTVEGRASTAQPSIVITNKSAHAIEAYRVSVRRDGQVLYAIWRDDCCFSGPNAQTPISSHERRLLGPMRSVPGFSIMPSSLNLDVAIFDDGTYEGSRKAYDQLIAQRRWAADAADYWIAAIQDDRTLDPVAMRRSLSGRLSDRRRASEFEAAAAAALGVTALVSSSVTESLETSRIDDTLTTIATAQKALRARLAAR